MKTKTKKLAKVFLLICAFLCAALVFAQFVPYWTPDQASIDTVKASYEEEKEIETGSLSILTFMALPSDYPVMEEYLGTNDYKVTDEHKAINSLASTFCVAFAVSIVAVIVIILKSDKLWVSIFPVFVGVFCLVGYLTEPLWALGSIYMVLVVLSALLTAASLVPLVIWFISIRNWFIDPKLLENK